MKKIFILFVLFSISLFAGNIEPAEKLKYKQWNVEKWIYTENEQKQDLIIFKAPCTSIKSNPKEENELLIIFDKTKNQYRIEFSILLYNKEGELYLEEIESLKLKIDNKKEIPIKSFKGGFTFLIINDDKISRDIIKNILNATTLSYELKVKGLNYTFIRTFDVQYLKDLMNTYNLKI